jgi:integrase/recombinase XerC
MSDKTEPQVKPFLEYLKFEKRYSIHTLTSYQTDLEEFFEYSGNIFGSVPLNNIDHNIVRSWLAGLKEKGLSAKSINRKISSLKSFFKYHLRTGTIGSSPMSKIISPKMGKRLPVFVKEEETKQMVETLNQSTENWQTLNAKMLVTIFYATGMRLSELINLKERQIDFSRSQIKVLGKGNKERIIPVNKNVVEIIREYQQLKKKEIDSGNESGQKNDPLLLVTGKGKKLYPKYAYLLVREVLGSASTLDKKSPHVLRHTFATHLMNNGADLNAVKELLGHSSLAATQVYTHNTIEKLKDIHKKAHPKA